MEAPGQCAKFEVIWRLSSIFIINFEQILHIVLLFFFKKVISIVVFEQVNAGWAGANSQTIVSFTSVLVFKISLVSLFECVWPFGRIDA